jgi:hypothetical protein
LIVLHFAFCLYLHHTTQTGFETATPASDQPQTLVLNRSATGIGFIFQNFQLVANRYIDWAIPAHP